MTENVEPFEHEAFLKSVTIKPGVYQMMDARGDVIYVGKAKNLKKRLSDYFQKEHDSPKTRVLVKQIHNIHVTVTHTENEALILEHNLIKSLKPRYNVLLRDDKSFPYVLISDEAFPRISLHRGTRKQKGFYFGPFSNAYAARQSINLVQKLFLLRQCENSYFRNRSRPCLQHQIKRCTAPCVGAISEQEYRRDVHSAKQFYEGKSSELINELVKRMEQCSEAMEYEKAARFRDQIINMRKVVEQQNVMGANVTVDLIAIARQAEMVCLTVLAVRRGQVQGCQHFFPKVHSYDDEQEIMYAFVSQFYLSDREVPSEIITSVDLGEQEVVLVKVIADKSNKQVRMAHQVKSDRAKWLSLASANAESAVKSRLNAGEQLKKRFADLKRHLRLSEEINRIECFDVSHTFGEATIASCVVFDQTGPLKKAYRKYKIQNIQAGDDYGAMRQALSRRFARSVSEGGGALPDVLVIDGGIGQLSIAIEVLDENHIDGVFLVSVVKGEGRKAEFDRILSVQTNEPIELSPRAPAKHLLQMVRDEAHRFAIVGHRQARDKARSKSVLEDIPGIGPKKRKILLTQFGGLKGIQGATMNELQKINGINDKLAKDIYEYLHREEN